MSFASFPRTEKSSTKADRSKQWPSERERERETERDTGREKADR
jgi:hypothetical protein